MLICFDLDGTLTNPQEGIVNAINYTLEKLGEPTRNPEQLLKYIGPTVHWIYKDLLDTEDEALIQEGRLHFGNYYREIGYKQNHLYDGILTLLQNLKSADHELCIVTAKSTSGAIKVAKHFNINSYFDGVYGRENDRDKTHTLMTALDNNPKRPAIMIGDRMYDMEAAVNCGCIPIGVRWGFGSDHELTGAGAQYLLDSPSQLPQVLTGL